MYPREKCANHKGQGRSDAYVMRRQAKEAQSSWKVIIFFLKHAHTEYSLSHIQLFVTPRTVAPRLLCPQDFPGKNTGVGCHSLLQRILLTQGLNLGLLLWQAA